MLPVRSSSNAIYWRFDERKQGARQGALALCANKPLIVHPLKPTKTNTNGKYFAAFVFAPKILAVSLVFVLCVKAPSAG